MLINFFLFAEAPKKKIKLEPGTSSVEVKSEPEDDGMYRFPHVILLFQIKFWYS